jgi:hypothetical protein
VYLVSRGSLTERSGQKIFLFIPPLEGLFPFLIVEDDEIFELVLSFGKTPISPNRLGLIDRIDKMNGSASKMVEIERLNLRNFVI